MENKDEQVRAVCYAHFREEESPVSKEQLIVFCNCAAERWVKSVERAYIDTCSAGPACNSPQWEQLVKDCKKEGISLVVIPTLSMVTLGARNVMPWTKIMKKEHGLDFYFLLECIHTKQENAEYQFEVEDLIQSFNKSRRDRRKQLRRLFADQNKTEAHQKQKERKP